jgi:ankyrin repeat protein
VNFAQQDKVGKMKKFFLLILLLGFCAPQAGSQESVTVDNVIAAVNRLDLHTVRQLLKQNPQAINEVGSDGEVPLSACIISRADPAYPSAKLDCIRFLLDLGADPNQRVAGIAPLESAMLVDIEIVKLLLEAGADPNDPADDGLTPLGTAQGLHGETAEEIRSLMREASQRYRRGDESIDGSGSEVEQDS